MKLEKLEKQDIRVLNRPFYETKLGSTISSTDLSPIHISNIFSFIHVVGSKVYN